MSEQLQYVSPTYQVELEALAESLTKRFRVAPDLGQLAIIEQADYTD